MNAFKIVGAGGNRRANDYRAMRDKLKAANAEIERLNAYIERCKKGNEKKE